MVVKFVMFKDGKRRDIDVPVGVTVLGRGAECGLRVPSDNVSRNHCQVTVKPDGVLLKDLGSSNGTFVNDRRITEQSLKPGDLVRVGPITFTVQINGKPAQIVSPEEIQAAMGADDSGEIPDMLLDDDATVVEELSGASSKDAAGDGGVNFDALDALDVLDIDDLDDEPDSAKK